MDDLQAKSIGYMKFSGESVPTGVIAADVAGNALLGFDDCIRYFNRKQSPALGKVDYEIPVKTTEGSWVVWVLSALGSGAAIYTASYLKKAGEKMAEHDFQDVGLKDVLRKSLDAVRHLIDLMKHTKGSYDWAGADLSWRVSEGLVGITNDENEVIYVPLEYFKWYLGLPKGLLEKVTDGVSEGRDLTIGVNLGDRYETASVSAPEKSYFGHDSAANEDEILLPELEHGDYVRLEGRLTRGNANSNSVGLEYDGHVINCVPEIGNIKRYKSALFLRCIVEGTVSRLFKQSAVAEKRPTIIFSDITPLEADEQIELFGR